MSYKVGVIRGDGIGPEIVAEALKVLDKVAEKYNETFDYTDILLAVHPLMQQESLYRRSIRDSKKL